MFEDIDNIFIILTLVIAIVVIAYTIYDSYRVSRRHREIQFEIEKLIMEEFEKKTNKQGNKKNNKKRGKNE